MDQNLLQIKLLVLTGGINKLAHNATTPVEKGYLYDLTETIGNQIRETNPNFDKTEFFKLCGVSTNWNAVAA